MEAKTLIAIVFVAAVLVAAVALVPTILPGEEAPPAQPAPPPMTTPSQQTTTTTSTQQTSTPPATTTTTSSDGAECEPVPEWAEQGIHAYTLWMNTSTGEPRPTLVACNGTGYYFSHVVLRVTINGSLGNGTWTIDATVTPLVEHEFLALNPTTMKPVSLGTYKFVLYDYRVTGATGSGEAKLYVSSTIGDWIEGTNICTVLALNTMASGIGVISAGGYTGTLYNYHGVPAPQQGYADYATEGFDEAYEAFLETTPLSLWEKYIPEGATMFCFTYPYAIWEEYNFLVSEPRNNYHLPSSPEAEDIVVTTNGPFKASIAGVELPFYNLSFKDYYFGTGEKQLLVEGYAVASPYTTMPLKYHAKFYAPNMESDVEVTIELLSAEITPLE